MIDEESTVSDIAVTAPRPLTWYPDMDAKGAWQIDCGRHVLTKAARAFPSIKKFHSFIVTHNDNGNFSRQEAVSMIPVLLLKVNSSHVVLDMCASPGSKTAQIVEGLGTECYNNGGFVVANDANERRSHMLAHQMRRLSGLNNWVVTCHLGQHFPGLYHDGKLQTTQVFDRILCDVPCSGDGTTRKNKEVFKTWHSGNGLTLHPLQVEITMRAAALLKTGGSMVYSTCTFNPIENEAVVAEVLRRSGGALELVDASDELPGLKRRCGLTTWSLPWQTKTVKLFQEMGYVPDLTWFKSFQDDIPISLLSSGRVSPSMFPHDDEVLLNELKKCWRLVPMDQNTGGFFVAVLRKTRALPGDSEEGLPSKFVPHLPSSDYNCKICNVIGAHFIQDCPVKKMEEESEDTFIPKEIPPVLTVQKNWEIATYRKLPPLQWEEARDFYGISTALDVSHLYTRSDANSSTYLLNPFIANAVLGPDLNVVNTGIKIFTRVMSTAVGSVLRPLQGGLDFLLPHMSKRVLHLETDAFFQCVTLLIGANIVPYDLLLPSTVSLVLESTLVGPVLLTTNVLSEKCLAFCIHLGKSTMGSLTPKMDLVDMLSLHQSGN